MKWINAHKQAPERGDLYYTKIVMKDTGLESFPSTNNFYNGVWEIEEDYQVVAWLYESEFVEQRQPISLYQHIELHEQYKKGYKDGFDAGVEETKLDIGKDFSSY